MPIYNDTRGYERNLRASLSFFRDESDPKTREAKKIALIGNYEEVRIRLAENGAFRYFSEPTERALGNIFSGTKTPISEGVRELIIILGLFETDLLMHSVRTFLGVHEMLHSPLESPSKQKVLLADRLKDPKVHPEKIALAALLHDVGKVEVPKEILLNSLSDDNMNGILREMFQNPENLRILSEKFRIVDTEGKTPSTPDLFFAALKERGMREVEVVPISRAFANHPESLFLRIKALGFTENDTIKAITRTHEPTGERILASIREDDIARMVGRHHNYGKVFETDSRYLIEMDGFYPDGSNASFPVHDIVKIADMDDALRSKRPYKKGLSPMVTLGEICRQSKLGRINDAPAYLFAKKIYKRHSMNAAIFFIKEERDAKAAVCAFLNETAKKKKPE